jgi:hypothetical protein
LNSVIIPADNAAKVLPRTLEHLSQQGGEFEVPAVDGGSTDATREVLVGFPLVRVLAAPKGRASQMNGGGRRATCVMYCDQAPFVRCSLFEGSGGLPEEAVMEDVLSGDGASSPRFVRHPSSFRARRDSRQ